MEEVRLDAAGTPAVLYVDPDDHLGRFIAKHGWYEKDLLDDARERVHGPGTAIDVGGHIGGHSVWFALACGLSVLSFEPNPDTYKRLLANVDANPSAIICTNNAAVDLEPGRGTSIPGPDGNTGMARFEIAETGDIPVVSLDSLNVRAVRLIKIDVEGTAPRVLRGGREVVERDSPVIYAEADDPDEVAAELPRGYKWFGKFAHTPTHGFARRPWWRRS